MNKLNAINLDNGVIQIHPYREKEMIKEDKVVDDLFEIYSDMENTEFIPEKRVSDKKIIKDRMFGIVLGYQEQLGYAHFLTLNETDKIIGRIEIITPKGVEKEYPIKNKWFIEFYLNKQFWNRGIMSGVLNAVIQNMKRQDIDTIAALCMPENIASIRVLKNCGFDRIRQFDVKQDYYELI